MVTEKVFKVLMVCSEIPPSFWSYKKAVEMMLGRRAAAMPPTGLATVAAMLPASRFQVLPIIDLNVEPLTDAALAEADLVMLTAMIVQRYSLAACIARAKRAGKIVVVGGPFATSHPDEVLAMGADYLVLDEAEATLDFFVKDFLAGRAARVYDERSVRGRQTVALTKEGKPPITATPIPRWDLVKLRRYASLAIQFSRGCPFDCEFCDIVVLYGHESRAKTNRQFLAELDAILATGWRGPVFVLDDNLIGNAARVSELLPELYRWQVEHGFPFSFFTEASINLANTSLRKILAEMVKAGFSEVFVGIEAIDPAALKEMNKKQNRGDLGEKVRVIQAAGLEVLGGFIVGNDADRPTVFDGLFEFIQENGIVMAMAGLLTALRGTPLYRRLEAAGRLRGVSSGCNTHRLELNFEPVMDEATLIRGYVGLLERLYAPRNYYQRCRILRQRRGPHRRANRLNRAGLLAAARVFVHYLFVRPDWEFVKFMLGTLFTAPAELPEAVAQAVKFVHFETLTEATVKAYRYPERVATLAERFQTRVAGLRGDLERRQRQLEKLKGRFLAKATREWQALGWEFRAGAKAVLENFQRRLEAI